MSQHAADWLASPRAALLNRGFGELREAETKQYSAPHPLDGAVWHEFASLWRGIQSLRRLYTLSHLDSSYYPTF